MTPAEIIYQRRIAVLEHAERTGNVWEACRVFGISRTSYYEWKREANHYGFEALMPKARRTPQMPDATPTHVIEALLTLAVLEPTIGCQQNSGDLVPSPVPWEWAIETDSRVGIALPRQASRVLVYYWCMSRTNIDIDEEACDVVMQRYRLATKREAVNFALRTLAGEPLSLEKARRLRGSGWEGDLEEVRAARTP